MFDGEGCITLTRGTKNGCFLNLRLVVSMTDDKTVRRLHEMFGGSFRTIVRTEGWATAYRWEIAAKQAENTLNLLLPYLYTKKGEAEIALRFRQLLPPKGNKNVGIETWEPLFRIREELIREKFKNNNMRLQNELSKNADVWEWARTRLADKPRYSRWINRAEKESD